MITIKKGIVLAAGMGSRFAPITKVIPKPMLPIGNRPVLDWIIDELRESGVEEIALVVGHRKELIEDYYRDDPRIRFLVQDHPGGTAAALHLARAFADGQPLAVCLGDEIVTGEIPCIRQLIRIFHEEGADMVTGVERTTEDKIKAFNSLITGEIRNGILPLQGMVEKPQNNPPSLLTSIGRYVFSPSIFKALDRLDYSSTSEVYATSAYDLLIHEGRAFGYEFQGKRWDIGTVPGWIEANGVLGLQGIR